MTSARECDNACPATCTPSPITALPSIRIGSHNHVVLGFSISNACVPACVGTEPCFNLGISYRHPVASSNQTATSPFICDLEGLFAGATFTASYVGGGTDSIFVSNVVFEECGGVPISLDLEGRGTALSVRSHFELGWVGDQVGSYTETRSYTQFPAPNTATIIVTNIDYTAQTYNVEVHDAETPTSSSSWGRLKVMYR